ncbi:MAG TPA: universal stress protein, partial [Gaiellaceae bacterium]|nr:universal stress protein [Gaiellaceae bacterium]
MAVFDRIVVGVDASDFGLEALQQALVLRAPNGTLQAVTVLEEAAASHAGFLAADAAARLAEQAQDTHERTVERLAGEPFSTAQIVKGGATAALLSACAGERATLVAVGGRHRSHAAGLLLGGVATVVLHDAPCSVLFARPQWGERWRPKRIVVGGDGSPWSLTALVAAEELAARQGSEIRVLAATGGKRIEQGKPWAERVDEWAPGHPVVNLVDASIGVDLIVVGSRGLHGLRSLGSVSERVAHRAHSSVLV